MKVPCIEIQPLKSGTSEMKKISGVQGEVDPPRLLPSKEAWASFPSFLPPSKEASRGIEANDGQLRKGHKKGPQKEPMQDENHRESRQTRVLDNLRFEVWLAVLLQDP